MQIRYSEGSAICKKLKEIFSYSQEKIENNEGESLNEESVDIYALGPSTLKFICFPKNQNVGKSGGEKVATVKGNNTKH